MQRNIPRRVATLVIGFVSSLGIASQPVSASHGSLGCSVPPEFGPLFDLLHSLTELAFLAGVLLGTLGFMAAGLMIASPIGEDWTRRGKKVAKSTLFGVIILLSAQMVVAFLVSQLGGVFC